MTLLEIAAIEQSLSSMTIKDLTLFIRSTPRQSKSIDSLHNFYLVNKAIDIRQSKSSTELPKTVFEDIATWYKSLVRKIIVTKEFNCPYEEFVKYTDFKDYSHIRYSKVLLNSDTITNIQSFYGGHELPPYKHITLLPIHVGCLSKIDYPSIIGSRSSYIPLHFAYHLHPESDALAYLIKDNQIL
jgi:hypothetical protein